MRRDCRGASARVPGSFWNSTRQSQECFLDQEVVIERPVRKLVPPERCNESRELEIVELLTCLVADRNHVHTRLAPARILGQAQPDRAGRLERLQDGGTPASVYLEPPGGRWRLHRGDVDVRHGVWIGEHTQGVVC